VPELFRLDKPEELTTCAVGAAGVELYVAVGNMVTAELSLCKDADLGRLELSFMIPEFSRESRDGAAKYVGGGAAEHERGGAAEYEGNDNGALGQATGALNEALDGWDNADAGAVAGVPA